MNCSEKRKRPASAGLFLRERIKFFKFYGPNSGFNKYLSKINKNILTFDFEGGIFESSEMVDATISHMAGGREG